MWIVIRRAACPTTVFFVRLLIMQVSFIKLSKFVNMCRHGFIRGTHSAFASSINRNRSTADRLLLNQTILFPLLSLIMSNSRVFAGGFAPPLIGRLPKPTVDIRPPVYKLCPPQKIKSSIVNVVIVWYLERPL